MNSLKMVGLLTRKNIGLTTERYFSADNNNMFALISLPTLEAAMHGNITGKRPLLILISEPALGMILTMELN